MVDSSTGVLYSRENGQTIPIPTQWMEITSIMLNERKAEKRTCDETPSIESPRTGNINIWY